MTKLFSAANLVRGLLAMLSTIVMVMVNDLRRNVMPRDEIMLRILILEREISEDKTQISELKKEVMEMRLKDAASRRLP